jgi:hypothetical protein
MTSSAPPRRTLASAAAEFDLDRLAWPGLAFAALVSALLTYHLTRGTSFLVDDWQWIDYRRGNDLHTFLAPYNGHLSLVPIAVYRVMFAAFGIGDFGWYRGLLIVVALLTGLIVFLYTRERVGSFCGLLLATLLLFLGPGWNDILQPFQIAWLIAVGGGVLAFRLLDVRRTTCDAAACLSISVALASTSVGVALAVGLAVDLLLSRRPRDLWIAGGPLALYVVWAIHYHPSTITASAVFAAPIDLLTVISGALADLLGLSDVAAFDPVGLSLTFGVSLLLLAVGAVVLGARAARTWARPLSLGVALLVFSLLTTLVRSFQSPLSSRYIYVCCVLVALIAVELLRELKASRLMQAGLAGLTVIIIISNYGALRSGSQYFRAVGAQTDATLAAVDLDRGAVPASTELRLPLYPLTKVSAGQYFADERALGTPADSLAQLRRASPGARQTADRQLIADGEVYIGRRAYPPVRSSAGLTVDHSAGGMVARRDACARLFPSALVSGPAGEIAVTLPSAPVTVSTQDASATLSVRRFGAAFTPIATVTSGESTVVVATARRAAEPWHLQVQSTGPVRVCLGPTA